MTMIKLNPTWDQDDPVSQLVVADMHLHQLPDWRLEWCDNFVDDLLEIGWQYGELGPVPDLVLLGDALELRDKVDARVANLIIEIIQEWEGRVIWVAGQHDSYQPYRSTFYALDRSDTKSGPFIVDEKPFRSSDEVWYVPYAREPERYRKWLRTIPDGARVFTHMPIKEVLEQFPGEVQEDWPAASDFDRFGQVFSGDIHSECTYGKVVYIGAVSQRDWRDAGVDGCIATVTRSGIMTRHRLLHPKHIKVTARGQLNDLPFGHKLVRVTGFDVTEAELGKIREQAGVMSVDWEPAPVEEVVDELPDLTMMEDPKQTMRQYLNSLELPADALSDDFLIGVGEALLTHED